MLRNAVIDVFDQLKEIYPNAVDGSYVESIDNLTPHMFRHTWATRKLSYLIENFRIQTPKRPLRDIHLQAMDMLRSLGGWSFNSKMPEYYARRYIHESANIKNLRRIETESEVYAKSLLEAIE